MCREPEMDDAKFNADFFNPTMVSLPPHQDYTIPSSFLSDENFEYMAAARRVSEEAIDWKDLPVDIIFRVLAIVPIRTKWGAQIIIELTNREGVQFKVWTPNNVHKDLKSGMKLQGSADVYIKSLGQKEVTSAMGVRKRYYDFETVFL